MIMKLMKIKAERENGRKGEKEIFSFAHFSFLILVLLSFGCQPNQTILKDAPPPTPMETVETKKTSFEKDLRDMETANFDYVFVFRRKDGGVFDKDDKKFLRQNTPPETNRFILSDEVKAFIAGSGFAFFPEQMKTLRNRFVVEDYSKPEIKEAADKAANANVNKQTNQSNTDKLPSNKKER